jgi:RNA polymerase sigma-70 factor (ECF subfamily)
MNHSAGSEELYEKFRGPLKNFIASRVSDSTAAEDLVHDVFVKIHMNLHSVNDPERIGAWIYQIARNAVTDYHRKRHDINADTADDSANIAAEPQMPDAADRLAPAIHRMIDQLPEKYRQPLLLSDFEGLKLSEIAVTIGISLSGVKSRVQRARKMLKDLLLQCCHVEFDRYGTVFDYTPRKCERCCEGPQECSKKC